MFFPKTPTRPAPRQLEALRLSLNAPLVTAPELPAGPARAAVVLFREEGAPGARGLEVVLRSEEGRQLVAYGFDPSFERPLGVPSALEAALTFAESMGFVFGDEALAGDEVRRGEGLRLWERFLEGAEVVAASSGGELELDLDRSYRFGVDAPVGASGSELELADVVEERPAGGSGRPPARPEPPGRRGRARKTAFGRVRLVKRQQQQGPGLLARLIGSF